MVNKKVFVIIILSLTLVQGLSPAYFGSLFQNMHDKKLEKILGKTIFSFAECHNGVLCDYWCYTNDLSRMLLVGKPKLFESVRWYPLVNTLTLVEPLFDHRFESFADTAWRFSLSELEEAIKDAILLFTFSSQAYDPHTLLDYLIEALRSKIIAIQNQMEHNFRFDQKSFSSLKKSTAWVVGLVTLAAIMARAGDGKKITADGIPSTQEVVGSVAVLGSLSVSCSALKSFYDLLTINPNACNQHLEKYEKLLSFAQNIHLELKKSGCLTFVLSNGSTAMIKDRVLTVNGEMYDVLRFG